MDWLTTHIGETMALLTALIWAAAVIMFRKSGETVHPIALNLFKTAVGFVLLVPTSWLFGESLFRPAPWTDYAIMIFSGGLGIAVADTLFFKSLNLLGAGMSAIVDCLYSPSIIALSMIWLGERLGTFQIIGAVMIISAVLTAVAERHGNGLSRKQMLLGVWWGGLAMFLMAIGVVMVKPLLTDSPLLWVTEYRLLGGLLFMAVILAWHPQRLTIARSLKIRHGQVYTWVGSFAGGYVSMVLWLAGMKYTQASAAAVLNQTSNIFIFILAAMFLKEPITKARLVGIILGVGGAVLVTFG
jgi:drug/metabolite transporter (DMT)-like permease